MGNNEEKKNSGSLIATDILRTGNESFVNSLSTNRVLDVQVRKTSLGQTPFAAVLSCIDSRVPVETIFNVGIGDIFSFRSAGNFVTGPKASLGNNNILGSLEFAMMSGVQLILVLGHTSCGAVKAALAGKPTPCSNTNDMIGRLKTNITTKDEDEAIKENVKKTIDHIRMQSNCLREFKIIGGVYNVSTGQVEFL